MESIRRQLPWLAIGFSIAAISLVGWLLTPSTVRISAMINGKMLHVTAIAPMWRSADSVEAHVLQATGTQSPGKAVDQMAEALAHLGITKYFIELGDLVRVGESRFPGR
ncbi:hypothetical protein EBR96_03740, partial [bacterium]|nr:hypothetical protein [bacterium]